MIYWLKYLVHFFTSNSRHGTHSPFVYALADSCIYANRENSSKTSSSYKALIDDILQFYNISLDDTEADRSSKAQVIFIESTPIDEILILQQQNFMLFVEGIHLNAANEKKWKSIYQSKETVVTIDLFHFGIVCYRTEQPKEHFKLRFPFWKY